MKINVGKSVLFGFITTLVVLAALALFSVSSIQRVVSTSRLLTHGLSVISNADLALKSILDIENGERGYVISGNEDFLDSFHKSEKPLFEYLRKLDSLTINDTLQHARLDTLKRLIEKEVSWTKVVIDARKVSFEKAQPLVSNQTGKLTVDSIRSCVKRMQVEENNSFRAHNTITDQSLKQMQNSFLALSVAIMAIIILLFYSIHKTLNARHKIEQELKNSVEEVKDLYNSAPCGYYSVDADTRITMMNDTLLKWLGYSREEVIGRMKFMDLLSVNSKKAIADAMAEGLKRYQQQGASNDQELEFVKKDGTSLAIIVNSAAVYDDQHRFVQSRSTVADNSARKRFNDAMIQVNENLETQVAERTKKLEESQNIYKSIASSIPGSAVLLVDREGKYLLAEGDLLEKMGYDREALLHTRISNVVPQDVSKYYDSLIDKAFAGESTSQENKTVSGNYTLMRVAGVKNDSDEIFAAMILLIDVSEIKKAEAELELLNATLEKRVVKRTEQLDRVNKELESFTYSVSHDLRAPLRGITGHAQILEEDYHDKLDEQGKNALQRIAHNALLMGQLIDDLLDFSRMGRKELSNTVININDLVKMVSADLISTEKDRKVILNQLPMPSIKGDLSMLRQVWINLISNALKYSRKKETTTIEIGSYKESEFQVYYIKDNGEGFDMLYADKLFGVFQRLHKAKDFEGTGVGLALVKTIIARHGGTVRAEGKLKEGATFYFTLPI